jgi:hypothetical protein
MRKLASIFMLILLAACAEATTSAPPGTATDAVVKTYPPHQRKIRVVRGDLPSGASYEVLGKVKAIKAWYGELSSAEEEIADRARAIGADAIIQEKAWHAPRAFSWAAPHAEGLAVKILKPDSINLEAVPGYWY